MEYIQKIKELDKRIWIGIGGLLILIVLGLSLWSISGGADKMVNIPLNGQYDNIGMLKNTAVTLRGNTLTGYDPKGKVKWVKHPVSENGVMTTSSDKIFIYEGKKLLILNSNGDTSKTVELPIAPTSIKYRNGIILQSDTTSLIMDDQGNTLATATDEDGVTTTGVVSPDKKNISLGFLKTKNKRIESVLYYYTSPEVLEFKLPVFDQIIQYQQFTANGKMVVATQSRIYIFNGINIEAQTGVNTLKAIGASNSNVYTVDKDSIMVYDSKLKLVDKIQLKTEYTRIASLKDGVIFYNNKGYSVYDGGKLKEVQTPKDIQRVLVVDNHVYLVFTDEIDKIY